MKSHLSVSIALIAAFLMISAQDTPQEEYIRKWAPTAVSEMYRSGVPASITLAQGLLESRYGLSELASKGNNHFGIKCHKDWKGKTMSYDDDAKGECFRVYESASESFQDHSDFLRYRDRYKFLFEFDTKDYKAWCYGLKKAGYATDPAYPAKLIKYIEDYKLYEYDSMTTADFEASDEEPEEEEVLLDKVPAKEKVSSSARESGTEGMSRKERKEARKAAKSAAKSAEKSAGKPAEKSGAKSTDKSTSKTTDKPAVHVKEEIPASPLSIEEPKKLDRSGFEEFKFSLSRQMYSRNGVPFVLSVEGETYSSIARSNNLFPKEILKFNDLNAEKQLLPGTIVYLQPKKSQCEKGLEKYIVGEEDVTLWGICQRFGVKMSSIVKMNGLEEGYEPKEGDTIVLRGKKMKK